jgi:hypothetical protein
MFGKVLTVLVRAILMFFGIPLVFYFSYNILPDLVKNTSPMNTLILFILVFGPMILDSMIDRDDKSNQTLTTNEKRNT